MLQLGAVVKHYDATQQLFIKQPRNPPIEQKEAQRILTYVSLTQWEHQLSVTKKCK